MSDVTREQALEAALLPCPFCGGKMRWNAAGGYALHDGDDSGCAIRNHGFTEPAKWNTRAAPDLAALALSRGAALAKAEAENARLREALDNLLEAVFATDEYDDRALTITGGTANLKWLLEAEEEARAALGYDDA